MSSATDTAAPCFYSYCGRFSSIPIWLPVEFIYSLSRKIKHRCDNRPPSTLSRFQVCKTNVASGSQHPVCCAFWCRFLLPARWLGSHGWGKRAEINSGEWSSHVRAGSAGSSCGSCPLTWLSGEPRLSVLMSESIVLCSECLIIAVAVASYNNWGLWTGAVNNCLLSRLVVPLPLGCAGPVPWRTGSVSAAGLGETL